jgi:hypothetical protein
MCSFDAENTINSGSSCSPMDGMTSAGLVAMPSSHRRESFLYRSSADQLLLKSTISATNEQYVHQFKTVCLVWQYLVHGHCNLSCAVQ